MGTASLMLAKSLLKAKKCTIVTFYKVDHNFGLRAPNNRLSRGGNYISKYRYLVFMLTVQINV